MTGHKSSFQRLLSTFKSLGRRIRYQYMVWPQILSYKAERRRIVRPTFIFGRLQ